MVRVNEKRQKRSEIVALMIKIYCNGNHHCVPSELCESCEGLRRYSYSKTEKCPFTDKGTFCSNCKLHCYEADMREEMKRVMRYSGKRIIFRHPLAVIHHFLDGLMVH